MCASFDRETILYLQRIRFSTGEGNAAAVLRAMFKGNRMSALCEQLGLPDATKYLYKRAVPLFPFHSQHRRFLLGNGRKVPRSSYNNSETASMETGEQ